MNHKPNYLLVQEEIKRRIRRGEWQPRQRIPAERDLERELGFSRITIGKGLSNLVAQGFLTRRQGSGTFVAAARPQLRRSVKFISRYAGKEQSFLYDPLQAMWAVLSPGGFETGVDMYRTPAEQIAILRRDHDALHAGLIVFFEEEPENLEELKRLQEEGFPFVIMDAHPEEEEFDFVGGDNQKGGELMVNHLVGCGHRRIAYVTWWPVQRSSLADRLGGTISAALRHGISFADEAIVRLPTAGREACFNIAEVMESLMSRPEPPTAVFFCNDIWAVQALNWALEKGLRIPQDVAIAGYDNVGAAETARVPLTTVEQDFSGMGEHAARLLLSRIEKTAASTNPVRLFLKPRLIVRASTSGP